MRKIFLFLVIVSFLLTACGQSYKVRNLRTNNVYILHGYDEGFVKGDTIMTQYRNRVVIDSVME